MEYSALTERQKMLVEENMNLIGMIMKTVPLYYLESREDAFQIGSVGLIKAARSYNEARNVLFKTYATRCIENELRMAIRHSNRAGAKAFICSLEDGEGNSYTLGEMVTDNAPLPEEICVAREPLAAVLRFIEQVRDDEARIILTMAMRRRSQEEIARAVGCTQSAVSRKLKRIRAQLREVMAR